tara:strand:+ start:640 stop:1083 length:444 start_codon:yes stop_codon:yes gene_type:complete
MYKRVVIKYIVSLMRKNIKLLKNEIKLMEEEKNNLTKSSAGDKHEVSRSLMQIEYDKLNESYKSQFKELKSIESLDLNKKKIIGLGSLVQTDKFLYFIAIGLGKHKISKKSILLVSYASPIGKLLIGKNKGDNVIINNENEKIISFS